MYGQPLEKKMWSQTFFVCPLGGSKKNFGPPEKKYGQKIAGDPNFFLHKMIIWYIVSCLKKYWLKKNENPGNIAVLKKSLKNPKNLWHA